LLEQTERSMADKDPNNPYRFLILLHLAATYETTPEFLDRAVTTQKQALALWPREFKDWSRDDLDWYRLTERYYLTYLEAQYVEVQRNGGRPPDVKAVAPIFPKAPFDEVGRDYQAGSFGPATADALPMDALEATAQLLLWVPNDNRLYWLYAELLNGRGFVQDAKGILIDLHDNRSVRPVRAHLRVLEAAPKPAESESPPSPPPPDPWVPNWRQIGGSFFAGAVVAAVGIFYLMRYWIRLQAADNG
jgi:hypothetical protein